MAFPQWSLMLRYDPRRGVQRLNYAYIRLMEDAEEVWHASKSSILSFQSEEVAPSIPTTVHPAPIVKRTQIMVPIPSLPFPPQPPAYLLINPSMPK